MFESMEYTTLQHYWFAINALLAALLVFMLFVQGGQMLIYKIGKTELEQSMIVNSIGRKWELTFTILVTFGGAFFASFPLFYSTSFGGAYWVWMIILFSFIIQAVSYEYRSKPDNFLGKKTYDTFLFINGLIATLFLGTAVATFFTGSPFHVDNMNHSFWDTPWRGLDLALDFTNYNTYINLSLGLAIFFLSRVLANMYFLNSIEDDNIARRAHKSILYNAIPFVVFFLFFLINILFKDGYALNPETGQIYMEPYKYLHNFMAMPVVAILFVIGVLLVLASVVRAYFFFDKCKEKVIWKAGIGTVLVVFNLLLIAAYNNTAYYPSSSDLQSSLTIFNSSSSHYTLVAMAYVSLMVPFVAAYVWYVWKSINNKKIDAEEIENSHTY
jgi:cytochrome d ubiquinol oxidase subunit II